MSPPLLAAERVSKKFCRDEVRSLLYGIYDAGSALAGRNGSRQRLRVREFWALQNASLELRPGDRLALLGLNGAGKTTLLRLLAGVLRPDLGRVVLGGRLAAVFPAASRLSPRLTGREHMRLALAVRGGGARATSRAAALADEFDLGRLLDSPTGSWSSGERARLALAAALALEPDVLLLDEAVAATDAGFRLRLRPLLLKQSSSGAVIFCTHSLPEVRLTANRAVVLDRGQLIDHAGDVDEALRHHQEAAEASLRLAGDGAVTLESESAAAGEDGELTLHLGLSARQPVNESFRLLIRAPAGELVAEALAQALRAPSGHFSVAISLTPDGLAPGRYGLSLAVGAAASGKRLVQPLRSPLVVRGAERQVAHMRVPSRWTVILGSCDPLKDRTTTP